MVITRFWIIFALLLFIAVAGFWQEKKADNTIDLDSRLDYLLFSFPPEAEGHGTDAIVDAFNNKFLRWSLLQGKVFI
jgi:hypothetical protein